MTWGSHMNPAQQLDTALSSQGNTELLRPGAEEGAPAIDWGHVDWTELNWEQDAADIDWGDVDWSDLDWGVDSAAIDWGEIDWADLDWTVKKGASDASLIDWGEVSWSQLDWGQDSLAIDWGEIDWGEIDWGADSAAIDWGEIQWNELDWISKTGLSDANQINWSSVQWNELDTTSSKGNMSDYASIDWGEINWGEIEWETDSELISWGDVQWSEIDKADLHHIQMRKIQAHELDSTDRRSAASIGALFGTTAGDIINATTKPQEFLTGFEGSDTFRFSTVNTSPSMGGKHDIIIDFTAAEGDIIDLSAIDANSIIKGNQSFEYVHAANFTAAGQLRFHEGMLFGNTDNNFLTTEIQIQLQGISALDPGSILL